MTLPRYSISLDDRVIKEIRRIPAKDAKRIYAAIHDLAENPFPPGACKLTNRPGWRIRIGDYRVLYKVESGQLTVFVFRAGHRREVYD